MLVKLENIKIGKITLDYKIDINNISCLVGENGVGKSSVLRILSAMFLPSIGSLTVNKKVYDLSKNDHKENWRKIAKGKIFYVDDDNIFLNENTTVEQNYIYFMLINNINYKTKKEAFAKLYNRFNIKDNMTTEVRYLSSGTKKKIIIIFSLLLDKNIILFDEPLNHLDKEAKEIFFELIKESKKDILFTSHDYSLLEKHNINVIEMRLKK